MRRRGHTAAVAALLLAAVLGASWVPEAAAATESADIQALLRLSGSVTNWGQLQAARKFSGWNLSVPVCTWSGIGCDSQGNVMTLNWQCDACGVRVAGTLPDDIGRVASLTTLNLQGNAFQGTLPASWGEQDTWPSLEVLFLNDNNLTGTLPPSWGGPSSFPKLAQLRLDQNWLQGTLPTNWGFYQTSMAALATLRLGDNELTGTIPETWGSAGSFPHLTALALDNNTLAGTLPRLWSHPNVMRFLQELYLRNNTLTGGLPPEWGETGSLPSLRFLYVSDNPLGGTLPPEWGANGSFPELRALGLSGLNVTGTLPPEWGWRGAMPVLDVLQLQDNDLSGSIPPEWSGDNKTLQRMLLRPGNSDMCGPTPPDLGFTLCDARDLFCLRSPVTLPNTSCPPVPDIPRPPWRLSVPPPPGSLSTWVDPSTLGGNNTSPAPPPPSQSDDAGGSSSFPVAAVVVPVVVVAAGALAGLGFFLARRRRRRRRAPPPAVGAARLPSDKPSEKPFHAETSSEEGDPELGGSYPPHQSPFFEVGLGAPIPVARGSMDGISPAATKEELSAASLPDISTPPTPPAAGAGGAEVEEELSLSTVTTKSGLVPWNDWEIRPEEIEIMKRPDGGDWELGSGGFGQVYKALRHGVQPVAVKIIMPRGDFGSPALLQARKEIAILRSCRDFNILRFVGAYLGPDRTMLVSEFMEGGDLMKNIAAGRVTWYRRGKKIAMDVAKALVFLHSRRIVHFDLKSPNILLSRDGTAKVGDVGMAKVLAMDYVSGVVSTLAWAAPEILWGQRCTAKADIYSFGVVLHEICSGEAPERGRLRDVRVPEDCPEEARTLMLECLEGDPRKRPTAVQLVERLKLIPDTPPAGMSASATPTSPVSPVSISSTPKTPTDLAQAPAPQRSFRRKVGSGSALSRAAGVAVEPSIPEVESPVSASACPESEWSTSPGPGDGAQSTGGASDSPQSISGTSHATASSGGHSRHSGGASPRRPGSQPGR
ncbi:hypothetical protein N2152v2_002794 [Parachlorella kessleri]